jgi:hypothetical protein
LGTSIIYTADSVLFNWLGVQNNSVEGAEPHLPTTAPAALWQGQRLNGPIERWLLYYQTLLHIIISIVESIEEHSVYSRPIGSLRFVSYHTSQQGSETTHNLRKNFPDTVPPGTGLRRMSY